MLGGEGQASVHSQDFLNIIFSYSLPSTQTHTDWPSQPPGCARSRAVRPCMGVKDLVQAQPCTVPASKGSSGEAAPGG